MTPSEGSASSILAASSDMAGWAIDGIDRVTGRVTGHITDRIGTSDGPTYALADRLDPGLGSVDVDSGTGRWCFTPAPASRLAAFTAAGADSVEFRVVTAHGPATGTVAVRVPVDPVEAAVTDTIEVGDGLVYAMAATEDRLYVLTGSGGLGDSGLVTVIDSSTNGVLDSIEAGSTPFGLVVGGDLLYVSNVDGGTVSVVDPVAGAVSNVIDVGVDPLGLAVCGDRLYVANGTGTVSVIDLDTNTAIAQIPTAGEPFDVIVEGERLYVTNYGGQTVSVIDVIANGVVYEDLDTSGDQARSAGGHSYVAAVTGGRLYVANSRTDSLTVVDGAAIAVVDLHPAIAAIGSIPAGAAPVDVVVCGDRLYVGNLNSGSVLVLETDTNQIVQTIESGVQPGLMAASPDGRTIYVADVMGGTVRVVTSVHEVVEPPVGRVSAL